MSVTSPLAKFWDLAIEAVGANDTLDGYDLDATNPESVARFQQLQLEEANAALKLIVHVQQYGAAIAYEMGGIHARKE